MNATRKDTPMALEEIVTQTDPRHDYILGLRALADILDGHPEVPLPYACGNVGSFDFDSDKVKFYCDTKDEAVAIARAFPGPLEKRIDDGSTYGFELHGNLHGLHFYAAIKREQVCTRVVTGTREVVTKIPAPDAPMIEVTQTVEDVEWICQPLLADDAAVLA